MRFTLGFLLVAFSFLPRLASSQTTIQGTSSYFYRQDAAQTGTTTTPLTLYGGSTAAACGTPQDGKSACDSCKGAAWGTACNTSQIYPGLDFQVTLSSKNSALYPNSQCSQSIYLTGNGNTLQANTDAYTSAVGSPITGHFTWQNLCETLSNDPGTCITSFNTTVQIGIDPTCQGSTTALVEPVQMKIVFRAVDSSLNLIYQTFNCGSGIGQWEGFCKFTFFPGDEKLFVQNATINAASSYHPPSTLSPTPEGPDSSQMQYRALRLYYVSVPGSVTSNSDATTALTTSLPYTDLPVDGNGNLTQNTITGLTNDTIYIAGSANVDDGGNVTYFSDPSVSSGPTQMVFTKGSTTTNNIGMTQSAAPEAVYGLLDNQKCFIATAAFGSEMGPELDTLRHFRNRILIHLPGGEAFIHWYYRNSPAYAAWLNDHAFLKPIVRGFLWPLIFVSDLLLEKTALAVTLALGFFALLAAITIARMFNRRRA